MTDIVLVSPVVVVSVVDSVEPFVSVLPFVTALAHDVPLLKPLEEPLLKLTPRIPKEKPLFFDVF